MELTTQHEATRLSFKACTHHPAPHPSLSY